MTAAQGPLKGIKVLEFASIGPVPFCGMLLSDLGADVVRIDRKGGRRDTRYEVTNRGRRSIALDLKTPQAVETCLTMMCRADVVFEGFRPGVMERLGLGPDVALARNPKLVYGRVTGWVFGGGALYLAFGMMAALVHARATGQGQVVDAATTDGAASLMAMVYGLKAASLWTDQRRANLLDGGAHMYDTYRCSDGKWVAIGSLEPQFYALLLEKAGLSDPAFTNQMDRGRWPDLKSKLASVIVSRSRDEWCAVMEGTDVCFAPVLSLEEAPRHPHNLARETFVTIEDVVQPAPAPRFSATPGKVQRPPPQISADSEPALRDWGFSSTEIDGLKANRTL